MTICPVSWSKIRHHYSCWLFVIPKPFIRSLSAFLFFLLFYDFYFNSTFLWSQPHLSGNDNHVRWRNLHLQHSREQKTFYSGKCYWPLKMKTFFFPNGTKQLQCNHCKSRVLSSFYHEEKIVFQSTKYFACMGVSNSDQHHPQRRTFVTCIIKVTNRIVKRWNV